MSASAAIIELVREALKDPAVRSDIVQLVRSAAPPSGYLEPLIGVAEAARILGMTKSAIRARCYRQSMPHTRVGRVLRFNRSDLLALIEAGRQSMG